MEQSTNASDSEYRQRKRRVLVAAAIFCALLAPVTVLFDKGGAQSRLLDFVTVIGFGILILSWCHYDSLERGKPFGSGFRVLVVLFGILALFVYLLKSRGFKQGLRSSGMALLVLLGMVLIMFVSGMVTALVFGIE
ncbi:MAG TPA: hypothetical protein VGC66_01630 [Pyrinomonadaceae bacterium]|jgi:peptidoglycan/LPS O-acetylase OafA/YrhL